MRRLERPARITASLGFAAGVPSLCNTPATRVCPSAGGEDRRTVRGCRNTCRRKTTGPRKTGGIGQATWMGRLARIGEEHGLFDRIGENHFGLYVDEGDTLLVAFDRAERARDLAAQGLPAGFEMVRRRSWSLLSVMSRGETWFLDDALTRFFRTLQARGRLRRVFPHHLLRRRPRLQVSPPAPMPGSPPGARVLAAGPVATLDPARAPFERRFRSARRLPFPGPLGFGPAGLATAGRAAWSSTIRPRSRQPPTRRCIPGPTSPVSGFLTPDAISRASFRRRRPASPSCAFWSATRPAPPRCARHSRTPAAGTPARWCGGRARR